MDTSSSVLKQGGKVWVGTESRTTRLFPGQGNHPDALEGSPVILAFSMAGTITQQHPLHSRWATAAEQQRAKVPASPGAAPKHRWDRGLLRCFWRSPQIPVSVAKTRSNPSDLPREQSAQIRDFTCLRDEILASVCWSQNTIPEPLKDDFVTRCQSDARFFRTF